MVISQSLTPLRQEKNALSFSNSPVVPAGVIFRKCLTKSSLFSDFALKARLRSILFVSGSGLVKDAGSKCRVSWNWLTISSTSLVEHNEMDWMELLTFSGSASSFRVVPWKWYRNNWKKKKSFIEMTNLRWRKVICWRSTSWTDNYASSGRENIVRNALVSQFMEMDLDRILKYS